MSKIHYELKPVDIPGKAHIDSSDARVYIYSDGVPRREARRIVIGKACLDRKHMYPNDNFRLYFSDEWAKAYGKAACRPPILHAGLYGLMLGVGHEKNIYPLLVGCYDEEYANMIMDISAYTIVSRKDNASCFDAVMAEQLLFSKDRFNDNRISQLYSEQMTTGMNYAFNNAWIDECRKQGTASCWLCIDGGNDDCTIKDFPLAAKGKAKSGNNVNIVSYMYAVDAETGVPVMYALSEGGTVDSKAVEEVITLLSSHGISIKGAVMDRGFCAGDVMKLFEKLGHPYIIMLKEDVDSHKQILAGKGEEIFWSSDYLIGRGALFGYSDAKKHKVFATRDEEAYIHLFFDGRRGGASSAALTDRIYDEVDRLNGLRANGKDISQSVEKKMRKYIDIVDGRPVLNRKNIGKAFDRKGFYSVACSDGTMPPEEVDRVYHLRDAVEKQFSMMKSQMGFDVMRVHSSTSCINKFQVAFIASILRSYITRACRKNRLDTNRTINNLDAFMLLQTGSGRYKVIKKQKEDTSTLLSAFDIIPNDFEVIENDVNIRFESPFVSQKREKPSHALTEHKRGGRKPGSKNKVHKSDTEEKPKRKVGRPLGAKDKKPRKKRGPNKKKVSNS